MHLNNKSGWQQTFTVARSVIEAKTGLKKDAYYKARNQLKQAGLIDFKERGTKATAFELIPFSSVKQTSTQTTTETTEQTSTQTTTATVTKQNETKQKREGEGAREENPFDVFQENFGMARPAILQSIGMWCDDLSPGLVSSAIKFAAKKGWRSFASIESILNEWEEQGIDDVQQARRYEKGKMRRNNNTIPFPREKQGKSIFDELREEGSNEV